jgi:hypothetical protein
MQISNVQLNTINRSSSTWEAYVNTGETTTLVPGQEYSMKITADEGSFCPMFDLRVYIDYNGDEDFTDAGEEVATYDDKKKQTFDFKFTVPADATLGTTRMRVMHKMVIACGHTKIEPCGTDNFVYHGEVEDYEIKLENQTGIDKHNLKQIAKVWLNPSTSTIVLQDLQFDPKRIVIYNASGAIVSETNSSERNQQISVEGQHGLLLVSVQDETGIIYTYSTVLH